MAAHLRFQLIGAKSTLVRFAFWLRRDGSFTSYRALILMLASFVGDGIVLEFDFGDYSNPLKEEKKPAYVITHKSIGGRRAKIVSPRTPGHGVMGAYFRNAGNASALTLFGHDLTSTQPELALRIFETLQFGGPPPRYVLPPPPPAKNVQ
jgi:hypothetical protein